MLVGHSSISSGWQTLGVEWEDVRPKRGLAPWGEHAWFD